MFLGESQIYRVNLHIGLIEELSLGHCNNLIMNKNQLDRDINNDILMTKQNIRIICEQEKLYELPELNSKLYLHFKGTFFF
jgi:hypothetical protein